jgi:hypothetical protein
MTTSSSLCLLYSKHCACNVLPFSSVSSPPPTFPTWLSMPSRGFQLTISMPSRISGAPQHPATSPTHIFYLCSSHILSLACPFLVPPPFPTFNFPCRFGWDEWVLEARPRLHPSRCTEVSAVSNRIRHYCTAIQFKCTYEDNHRGYSAFAVRVLSATGQRSR